MHTKVNIEQSLKVLITKNGYTVKIDNFKSQIKDTLTRIIDDEQRNNLVSILQDHHGFVVKLIVSFVTDSRTKMTAYVKFEVCVYKWGPGIPK